MPILEAVNRDAVSSTSLLPPEWIGKRSHARKNVLAVQAERQPKKIGLFGSTSQPFVRKIGEFIRLEIEHRERLFLARTVGPVSAVQQHCKPPVGRKRNRRRQIVDRPRRARNITEQFAVRQPHRLRRFLPRESWCQDTKKEKGEGGNAANPILHRASITSTRQKLVTATFEGAQHSAPQLARAPAS